MVDDISEHKKAKGVKKANKYVVEKKVTINTKMFFNSKCVRHLMIIILHFYMCFTLFDDKMYNLNNGYDGLVLGYYS